jgi:hypothetical protein
VHQPEPYRRHSVSFLFVLAGLGCASRTPYSIPYSRQTAQTIGQGAPLLRFFAFYLCSEPADSLTDVTGSAYNAGWLMRLAALPFRWAA